MTLTNWLGAIAAIAALSVPAFAQLTGLEGDVKGADGKLVPNTVVRIARLDASRTYPTKTDKKGHYFYSGLPAGLYSITVEIDGRDAVGVSGILTQQRTPMVVDLFLADTPEQRAERTRQQVRKVGAEWSYIKPMFIQGSPAPDAPAPSGAAGQTAPAAAVKQPQGLDRAFSAGLAALEAKQYDEAIVSFKKALEADPKQAIVWANLATAQVRLAAGQTGADSAASLQQGLDSYAKAIELKPDEAVFHNNYALALARAGKYAEMQSELKKAAALDPPNAYHFYYNLGLVLTNAGQSEAAAEAFQLAIAAAPDLPDNAESYYQYGVTLMSKAESGADGKVVPAPGTVEALRSYLERAPAGPNAQAARDLLVSLGSSPPPAGKKK